MQTYVATVARGRDGRSRTIALAMDEGDGLAVPLESGSGGALDAMPPDVDDDLQALQGPRGDPRLDADGGGEAGSTHYLRLALDPPREGEPAAWRVLGRLVPFEDRTAFGFEENRRLLLEEGRDGGPLGDWVAELRPGLHARLRSTRRRDGRVALATRDGVAEVDLHAIPAEGLPRVRLLDPEAPVILCPPLSEALVGAPLVTLQWRTDAELCRDIARKVSGYDHPSVAQRDEALRYAEVLTSYAEVCERWPAPTTDVEEIRRVNEVARRDGLAERAAVVEDFLTGASHGRWLERSEAFAVVADVGARAATAREQGTAALLAIEAKAEVARAQVAESEAARAALVVEVGDLRWERDALLAERDDARSQADAAREWAEAARSERVAAAEEARTSLASLASDVERTRTERDALEGERDDLLREVVGLDERHDLALANLSRVEEELATTRGDLREAMESASRMREEARLAGFPLGPREVGIDLATSDAFPTPFASTEESIEASRSATLSALEGSAPPALPGLDEASFLEGESFAPVRRRGGGSGRPRDVLTDQGRIDMGTLLAAFTAGEVPILIGRSHPRQARDLLAMASLAIEGAKQVRVFLDPGLRRYEDLWSRPDGERPTALADALAASRERAVVVTIECGDPPASHLYGQLAEAKATGALGDNLHLAILIDPSAATPRPSPSLVEASSAPSSVGGSKILEIATPVDPVAFVQLEGRPITTIAIAATKVVDEALRNELLTERPDLGVLEAGRLARVIASARQFVSDYDEATAIAERLVL